MLPTKQKLQRLEALLREHGAPVLQHFNPGLPAEEVQAFLEAHHIAALPSLVALYEWHNGVKTIRGHSEFETNLLPFGTLFSLEEMLQMREVFYGLVKNFEEPTRKALGDPANYIPILGTGKSDMYLLRLSTGQVLCYQPHIQIFGDVWFRSIDGLLDCIIECFETGVFTIDPQAGLEEDFLRFVQIKDKHLGGGKR